MSRRQFVIGTLAGGVTIFAVGYAIFAVEPFRTFYGYAINAGSAAGVQRDVPLTWAVAIGSLAYSALITLVIGSRVRPVTFADGAKTGAVVGFLLWAAANFMLLGVTHVGNVTSTIGDSLLELVPGAMAGGVIGVVLGRLVRRPVKSA